MFSQTPSLGSLYRVHVFIEAVFAAAAAAAAAAKSLQSCPNLCDPIDSLLPGSTVPGILQARTLEWVDNPRQPIKKQRHHFADKCLYSQSYGFSSSHVQIGELDHKEGLVPKN